MDTGKATKPNKVTKLNIGQVSFALIDVKVGRKQLAKVIQGHRHRVPVTLKGYIVDQWSGDDGTSIEFEVTATATKFGKPIPHLCRCIRCVSSRAGRPVPEVTRVRRNIVE